MRILNMCPVAVGDMVRYVRDDEEIASEWEPVLQIVAIVAPTYQYSLRWKLLTARYTWHISAASMFGIEVQKRGELHEQNT